MTPFPPYARLLRLAVDDQQRIVMPFHEDVVGRPGFLHGGAIAGLLEFAAYSALVRAAGEGLRTIKPVTVTVDYLRGGIDRDTLADGTVERLGKRLANVEAVAWQQDRSRPIAAARITFLLER